MAIKALISYRTMSENIDVYIYWVQGRADIEDNGIVDDLKFDSLIFIFFFFCKSRPNYFLILRLRRGI